MNDSPRKTLAASLIHPNAQAKMAGLYPETIREVQEAISTHAVVVVGMAQNPHVRSVKKALSAAGIAFHYLEYGSYLSEWRRRLAIKMWSGWPTFPQVFVRGVLIGGEDLTKAALSDGTLRARLGEAPTNAVATPA